MTSLVVYGDFNCPFSALASARVDELLARGDAEVRWRAVEHAPDLPRRAEPLEPAEREALDEEVEQVAELSAADVRLRLAVPPMRCSTRAANAAYAGALPEDRHRLRRRLFAAVWVEGRDITSVEELERLGASATDRPRARRWQSSFIELPELVVPSLVTEDGEVLQGLDALEHLAALVSPEPAGR